MGKPRQSWLPPEVSSRRYTLGRCRSLFDKWAEAIMWMGGWAVGTVPRPVFVAGRFPLLVTNWDGLHQQRRPLVGPCLPDMPLISLPGVAWLWP